MLIDLGNIPLVNNLCKTRNESLNCKRYPLRVIQDENLTMRLDTVVPADEMFSTYLYRSAVNRPYYEHCQRMWKDIESYQPRRVVDIGGNDGTLLRAFRSQANYALELINVDASQSVRADNEAQGIHFIHSYWGDIKLDQKADLIVSTNVFQHNSDVHKFLAGIRDNLDGIWLLEFPYFLETVRTDQFDQIYHEHYYYWLVTPLVKLFREYGLSVISISEHPIHGGTLRIISTNRAAPSVDVAAPYLAQERAMDFAAWAGVIERKIQEDRAYILSLPGRIACFGAAAKGCVYLNSLNLSDRFLYVVDDTLEKQGFFVPGTGLEVVSRSRLYADQPDHLIILAHNFRDYIAKSLRGQFKGKMLTMLPKIEYLNAGV